ncbi:MAG: CHAP domain-containing protein [Candidatus Saccharimonas sp.]
MSFSKTVLALAIISAASIFGSQTTFAVTEPQISTKDTSTSEAKKVDEPVVVTVNAGDSLSSIADTYHTSWVRIFNANESIVNPDLIDVGQKFRIPKDDEQLPDRFGSIVEAPTQSASTTTSHVQRTGTLTSPSIASGSAGNRYAWGNCTWYVYNRKPNIGSFWGNAYQWLGSAQASGYATGSAPVAGAIGVESGHVVYVESVNGGMVSISEMNYAGGVGVVHYRTVPAGTFSYIYA